MDLGPLGTLFELSEEASTNPLSTVPRELWVIGQVAAVVLLFVAGLEDGPETVPPLRGARLSRGRRRG